MDLKGLRIKIPKLMKKMRNKIITLVLALGLAIFVSCEKDTPRYLPYEGYSFTELNENGGDWTPVLEDSGASITVDAPDATDSQAYQDELADMKQAILPFISSVPRP